MNDIRRNAVTRQLTGIPAALRDAVEPQENQSDVDFALVSIGVDFYLQSNLPSLCCAVSDAENIYSLLASRRRKTHVALLTNAEATLDRIRQAVVNAARQVSEDGTLMLTFSGHGVPLQVGTATDDWEAAFLTFEYQYSQDSEFGSRKGFFTLRHVKKWLNDAKLNPRNIVVILDACGAGTAITHSRSADRRNVRFDGRQAFARSLGTQDDALVNAGKQTRVDPDPDGKLQSKVRADFDDGASRWPQRTSVVVLSAATGGGVAYEIPELGQGVLSCILCEWLSEHFLQTTRRETDVGDLFPFVKDRIRRLATDKEYGAFFQRPVQSVTDEVEISNAGSLGDCAVSSNLLTISRTMPVPQHVGEIDMLNVNVEAVLNTFDKFDAVNVTSPGNANLLIETHRFGNTRPILCRVAARLAEKHAPKRPALYLGTGRIRRILSLFGSLEAAFETDSGRYTQTATAPAMVSRTSLELVNSFIDELRQRRAIVVAPFRREECDELMTHFLRSCARTCEIRLVLATFAGEFIPEWLSRTHFQRVEIQHPTLDDFKHRLAELDLGIPLDDADEEDADDNASRIPPEIYADTVVSWLERLKEANAGLDQGPWHALMHECFCPYAESGNRNGVRVVLSILGKLLEWLEKDAPECVHLLKAISTISLPRSWGLIENLWNGLLDRNIIQGKDLKLDATLKRLVELKLIREPDRTIRGVTTLNDHVEDAKDTDHYFVHWAVRQAAEEHEDRLFPSDYARWNRLAGAALGAVAGQEDDKRWWPRSVLAHEAVYHFLKASQLEEESALKLAGMEDHASEREDRSENALCDAENGAEILRLHWRELVDSGYHEALVRWTDELTLRLGTASLEPHDVKRSLEQLVPLLVDRQTLHKHRQEWGRIHEVHDLIERLTRGARSPVLPNDRQPDPELASEEVTKWFARSLHNLANYHFIMRDFETAEEKYESCRQWAESNGDADLKCSCLIRFAHCAILLPSVSDRPGFKERIQVAFEAVGALESPTAHAKHYRHLRTIFIELGRLSESHDELYQFAVDAWTDALKAYPGANGQARFDLAIANVHMGWASMVRGEFLRAWRHALQARRLLNDRGIPEHWWYGETERIAALAISRIYARNIPKWHKPWFAATGDNSDTVRKLFPTALRERQRRSLEELIKVCRVNNPWRAAELRSALGQFLVQTSGEREEGIRQLEEALHIAEGHEHVYLQIRVLEALAVIEPVKAIDRLEKAVDAARLLGHTHVITRIEGNLTRLQAHHATNDAN